MRILIDAMGGDNAPDEIVRGAVMAAEEFGVDITLVGRREEVLSALQNAGGSEGGRISVVHAEEVISMEDDPATATRSKKNSSMSVMLSMLARGEGDACISAGSTGALLSGATLTVKRIRGVRRGCFAPVIPNGGKGVMIIDCGANVVCTAEYLLQFAHMGNYYAREILGIPRPKVGLLNIGSEDSKGTDLQKETNELLRRAAENGELNYIGNVESSELLTGKVDVLVCDGFSGNVLLKSVEGTASFLMKEIKKIFYKSTKNKLAALVVKNDVSALKSMMDVSEIGGTALLGLQKPVIKAHGSSDARAVRSAVRQAIAYMEADVIGCIEKNIAQMRVTE